MISSTELVYGYDLRENEIISIDGFKPSLSSIKYLEENNLVEYFPNLNDTEDTFYLGISIISYDNSQDIFESVKSFKSILERNRELYFSYIDKKIQRIIEFYENQLEEKYSDNPDTNLITNDLIFYFRNLLKVFPKELSLPSTN